MSERVSPFLSLALMACLTSSGQARELIRSLKSGAWSAADTWQGGKVPGQNARVQVQGGHTVVYDTKGGPAIRFMHVAGTLSFAPDRDTQLEVGLIKIQAGQQATEEGFDCDAHQNAVDETGPRPALEVGTPGRPIAAGKTATIRLRYFDGQDRQSCPAIVCCGGRMDFHGQPLSRTWLHLASTARAGDSSITLDEAVTGWKTGDRIIVAATTRQNKIKKTFKTSVRDAAQTEERLIKSIDGTRLTLDSPLSFEHRADGAYRAEVANLSRNVVVESAEPAKARGHTMYHRQSAGSISYAEFRHLGMEGVLGRYSLHFHLAGDTMRGSSVIGASIWDSGNRWITIHGTNYLVVRDCVGYRSVGHGFFLEDGTEVFNVLDRNLAVEAFLGKPLPKQVLPFDKNDGSGFWWANSLNTFTRNSAVECDEYGYFFQATKTKDFDPVLNVQQPDGSRRQVDIRTLPFVRFEDNETHCQRRHGFNLGGGVPFGPPNVNGVGPDEKHPFVIRNLRCWDVHWAIHPVSPSVLLDNLQVHNAEYGVWRPVYSRHVYTKITTTQVPDKLVYAFVSGPPDKDQKLDPVDDLPPVTVITHTLGQGGKVKVRGTTSDNGRVVRVLVNGQSARPLAANFAEWEIDLPASTQEIAAHAVDASGNTEVRPHVVRRP